jgi:hypothetical protein
MGILLLGFRPYVTNTVQYGHPFFPFMGRGGANHTERFRNYPADFRGKPPAQRLLISLFSRAQMDLTAPTRLKVPFSIAPGEEQAFYIAFPATGGFGPLFGGLLILYVITLAALLRASPRDGAGLGLLSVLIFISAVVNQEAWWVRYVPQLFALPALAALAALARGRGRLTRALGVVILGVLLLNLILVGYWYAFGQYVGNAALGYQLKSLSLYPGRLFVQFEECASNRIRLKRAGIDYIRVDSLEKTLAGSVRQERLRFSTTRITGDGIW